MLPVPVRRRRGWEEPLAPMERMFDRFFGPLWPEKTEEELTGVYPVDVREEEGTLIVDAEVPGFKRDEIEVSIENGMLHIVAERKPEEHKGTRHLTERRYTRVERAFTLPAEVDESKVQAKLDNGVLHLEMPEVEEKKARRIEVK